MNTSDTMQQFTVTVRLLNEEMEILTQKASEAKLSKSAFVRNAIRYGGAYPCDLERLHYDFTEILSSLFQVIHGAPK